MHLETAASKANGGVEQCGRRYDSLPELRYPGKWGHLSRIRRELLHRPRWWRLLLEEPRAAVDLQWTRTCRRAHSSHMPLRTMSATPTVLVKVSLLSSSTPARTAPPTQVNQAWVWENPARGLQLSGQVHRSERGRCEQRQRAVALGMHANLTSSGLWTGSRSS